MTYLFLYSTLKKLKICYNFSRILFISLDDKKIYVTEQSDLFETSKSFTLRPILSLRISKFENFWLISTRNISCYLLLFCGLMSQSIPTGYIPRATPGKFFWASESRSPEQFFCLARRKKWWSNSWGWGKIFSNSKKLLLKLAKNS